ncbi:hypothetical protein M8818_005439 [Zalaria obscura]|uniref:Uncharacterized protein n=1 Tax=Zalaria obscura TaxID=2024903 RepID=A0ACC3S7Y1_9PEZI
MGKRKRKSQNNGAAAPAQQSHHTGPSFHARRPISYGDIDEAPASPPKRRQISYASSDLEDEKPDNESSNTKTTIHSTKDKPQQQPQLDVDYGQRGAFPGLDNSNEPFYGPANDGLDYLRMVR